MRASELKIFAFHTIKVIFSTCFCRFSKLLNFLEFFHFPESTWKESGFPGIREISFKAETLDYASTKKIRKRTALLDRDVFVLSLEWRHCRKAYCVQFLYLH